MSITKITGTQARQKYSFRKEEQEQEYLEISVCDNGSGIDEKDWETIFDRYKQVEIDGKLLPDYSGTGIGLNFTKSLVELHKGKIRLESKLGQGSTFSFILPFNNEGYNEQDFAVSQHQSEEEVLEHVIDEIEILTEHPNTVSSDFEKTLLIVEDDPQLNNFLTGVLKDYYKIISAHDGEKGLELVRKVHPDIVISDVMMPKKNGYELTVAIKESREICHIPVILLTAKTDMSSQIEGMNCGADLYIPKPFNVEFLLSAINTQLKNRERIHEIFLNGQMPSLERSEINQLDMQFLSKLNALLEKELSNSSLDIQMIAQNLNLSRSVFYRKFTSLTKLSPIAYIKKYRINKAVEFIKTGKYSLGEIGEMTGFGSPSYFSTAFKQEKGVSPREFVSQIKDADAEN